MASFSNFFPEDAPTASGGDTHASGDIVLFDGNYYGAIEGSTLSDPVVATDFDSGWARLSSEPLTLTSPNGTPHELMIMDNGQLFGFTNTSPAVTLVASNAMPAVGEDVVFTATVVDPDVPPQTLTYIWTVAGTTVQTTSDSSSLTDTYTHSLSAEGSATICVTVRDSGNGVPAVAQSTAMWADAGFMASSTGNFYANAVYAGTGSTVTFNLGSLSPGGTSGTVLASSGLPTVNTTYATFTVRAGASPTNFANTTLLAGFGGFQIQTARLVGNNLILNLANQVAARNFMAILEGEPGWAGSGGISWGQGVGAIGIPYHLACYNVQTIPISIIPN